MAEFANADDVAARWRPLTGTEYELAEVLIEDASDIIRTRWPDIDDRVAAGTVSRITLIRIVSGMVRRAMMNRDVEGITQMQSTTGPFSDGATYANPNNNLYLSADDIRALEPFTARAKVGWLL